MIEKIQTLLSEVQTLKAGDEKEWEALRLRYMSKKGALNELMNGATPDQVQEILLPLRELREAYITTSLRARDYLDWYEITHLGEKSHKEGFTAYLETMQMLRREKPGPETHISRYLQDIEELFGQKAGEALPERLRKQARESRKARKTANEQ